MLILSFLANNCPFRYSEHLCYILHCITNVSSRDGPFDVFDSTGEVLRRQMHGAKTIVSNLIVCCPNYMIFVCEPVNLSP